MQFVSPLSVGLPHTLGLAMPHGMEWIVIVLVALLVFAKRLPGMARGIGQGIVEFKRGLKGAEAEGQDQPRFDPQTGKPLEHAESTKVA